VKIGYILWLLVTGVIFSAVRIIGNPFSNEVQYRIEYVGGVGKTLWGNYTITPHDKSQSVTTERAIGQLPQTVNFTTGKNAIVSANGSTASQEAITIEIYKNGVKCSNSDSTGRAGVSDTIVCR
jgi:hypothetical protein